MINHRVQVRRLRQHGHVQHGSAAPGVKPAAAEIQAEGGKAGFVEISRTVQVQAVIASEPVGKDDQGHRRFFFREPEYAEHISVGALDNDFFHRTSLRKNCMYDADQQHNDHYCRNQPLFHGISSRFLFIKTV